MKYSKELRAILWNFTERYSHNPSGELATVEETRAMLEEIDRLTAELAELKETKIADIEKGLFFGKPVEYWLRLQNQAQESTRDKDIEEILLLKSLVFAREQDLNELHIELSQLRERTRWIPVSERLPKKKGEYLTVTEGARNPYGDVSIWVEPVEFYSECGHWGCGIDRFVTHWMPLPEPPKAD